MTVQEWLGSENKIGIDIFSKKYMQKGETFLDAVDRISCGDEALKDLILEKLFLFGGRALSNRGVPNSGSMFNCYSSGYCADDLNGIMQLNTNLALTYKAQGGQGVSLTKIRPKGTPVGGRYTSDGIIPFLKMFNQTTATISQGGSRKGALMVSLDIRHKEAEEFINIKTNSDEINKANLSLEIDDEFMKAVDQYYKYGDVITLREKKTYGKHTIEYDLIPINLYKLFAKNCYDWGEPAALFTEKFRNYNLMEFDDDYEIETSNPCGEQPLPKDFCCNLGSINLSELIVSPYTKFAYFDWTKFLESIYTAVEALDVIIDENKDNHALKEQSENSINYRNIGLGVMGYATALMKLGIKYGSEDAKVFTDDVFKSLFKVAVCASNALAKEKGTFPKYKDVIFESEIIKNHFNEKEIEFLRQDGLRNCSLISVAPTGSIATLLGISTGCEPEFAIKYTRKTESLNDGKDKYYDVYCAALAEYQAINKTDDIPDYFVSSSDIPWRDRIDVQALMQHHVDTAISSTVNLHEEATVDEVEQLYLYAWEKGLKGITIFRNGCKREGILSKSNPMDVEEDSPKVNYEIPRGYIMDVPNNLNYRKYKIKSGCGNLYLFVGVDEDEGKIYDVFTNTDGVGGCTVNTQAVSRLISACTRGGVPIEYVVEQLTKSGTCASYQSQKNKQSAVDKIMNMTKGFLPDELVDKINDYRGESLSSGKSCPSAISNIITSIIAEIGMDDDDNEVIKIPYEKVSRKEVEIVKQDVSNPCPECDMPLKFEGGCVTCSNCGFSKCG